MQSYKEMLLIEFHTHCMDFLDCTFIMEDITQLSMLKSDVYCKEIGEIYHYQI